MNKIILTESLQDYIETIYRILLIKPVCRVNDISENLNVSKASVVQAISLLKEKKLISQEKYGYIEFTPKGEKLGKKYYDKYIVIKNFLVNVLKVPEEEAKKIACGIEHHIENKYLNRLKSVEKNILMRENIKDKND